MTQYRKPTAADIGKTVELSNDGEDWFPSGELESIHHYGTHSRYWGMPRGGTYARIPVTTAADELLVAADMLNDCGMDGAAEQLRLLAEANSLLGKPNGTVQLVTLRPTTMAQVRNLERIQGNLCEKHAKERCCVCGKPATHECDWCGQFVCGAPICDTCTHRH